MMASKKKALKEKMAQEKDKEKNQAQKDKIAQAMVRVQQAKEDKK
jgi:hypothetical protein